MMPLRSTLSYGPDSVTMLSPATATTRTGTGLRPGNTIVQPVVSPVAVKSYVTSVVSPASFFPVTAYLPATSLSETGAGASAAGAASGAATTAPVSAGWFSDFVQATKRIAEQSRESRRIRTSER